MRIDLLFGAMKTGKSTFLTQEKSKGKQIISGSDFAYELAEAEGRRDIALARRNKDNMSLPVYNRNAARYAIINWIENELILGRFGSRTAFVRACIESQFTKDGGDGWWGIFDNIEGNESITVLKEMGIAYDIYEMNRAGFPYGVDGREAPNMPHRKIWAADGDFLIDHHLVCDERIGLSQRL